MDSIEAIIEEFEIEKLMRDNGVARFHKNVDKAVEKAQESKTEYGKLSLHKTKLEMLTEAIERYLKQYKGVKGRIPIAHEKLSKIEPVLNQHRLIVDHACIKEDFESTQHFLLSRL